MNRLPHAVRPIGLAVIATILYLSLIWLNLLSLDEFASKFILSDKVLKLHRLIAFLTAVQWLLMLLLIRTMESRHAKQRKEAEAEPIV